MTAVLHAQGKIVELNPIMRVLIEQSEWLFALAKFTTLFLGWMALRWYANSNLKFVRKASLWGSGAYVTVWCLWFFGATFAQPQLPATEIAPAVESPAGEDEADPVIRYA